MKLKKISQLFPQSEWSKKIYVIQTMPMHWRMRQKVLNNDEKSFPYEMEETTKISFFGIVAPEASQIQFS